MKKHTILYLLSISSFAIIISLLPVTTAYAGDINEQESEVLEALKGPFKYNGQTYVPLPSYLQLAREYLLADNINLTPEQKGKAIAAIRANVEMAISNGFIVPFEEKPNKDSTENKVEGSEANTDGANENSSIDENNNEDKNSDSGSLKGQENNTSEKESITSNSDKESPDELTHDSEKVENKEENIKTEEAKTTDNHGLKEEGTQDKVGALTNGEQPDGLVTEGNEDFMIKDTGYHVNSIVIFLGILLVAMMGTSYYLLYQVIIAKQNDS